ncbi:MAG: RNA polymerase sigma factor [Ignavibacteriales bacterium]|nr:RNA polymerase sigma factor [Ignavibacteriales bacterium]
MSDENKNSGTDMLDDADLILRAQKGDMVAFESLVQKYDKRVFTIAASYVSSADDAKDIFQEVFVRVYKGLKKFELRSEFSTWLYRITTNVCLTHTSRSKKRSTASLDEESDEEDGASHPLKERIESDAHTDQRAMNAEISCRVEQALQVLSPQQRMVFTLRHYQGYKLREIAGMMKLSEGAVKKYLFDATQRMREQLKEYVN